MVDARAVVEGVFCEPASAAGIGALRSSAAAMSTAVCIVTGHGLRDPRLSTRPRNGRRRLARRRARRRSLIVARAPASTATLARLRCRRGGARPLEHVEIGYGSFAVELDGEGADELPRDASSRAGTACAAPPGMPTRSKSSATRSSGFAPWSVQDDRLGDLAIDAHDRARARSSRPGRPSTRSPSACRASRWACAGAAASRRASS